MSKPVSTDMGEWQPACSEDVMMARAELYALTRAFFYEKGVLEVETPIISQSSATDPCLASVSLSLNTGQGVSQHYLQTSPEFAMKRILARYSRPIYQICKTFRSGESGVRHNPEFSMLEWYRPGFSLAELRDEAVGLIERLCWKMPLELMSYREAFLRYIGVDPFSASDSELESKTRQSANYDGASLSRMESLDLLMTLSIEPHLGRHGEGAAITVIEDYPSEQASLAKIKTDTHGHMVAERFEVYINGLEIANAYHELTDAAEQAARFAHDNRERQQMGEAEIPPDNRLLAAMQSGLPQCSGIALGLDRLLMIKCGAQDIASVLAFPVSRA